MQPTIKTYWQNFIGGEYVDGGAGRLRIDDPATGDALAEQALADAADVDRAVAAARRCHESGALPDMRPVERGRLVRGMGEYLLQRIDEISHVLTRESGKPLWEARMEVQGAARYFEYYGNQAETLENIERFAKVILDAGIPAPVRRPRGRDILAACGQLKSETMRQRKGRYSGQNQAG